MWVQPINRVQNALLAFAALLLLAACAETELVFHAAKQLRNHTKAPAQQSSKGVYKVGVPYQIDGAWYYPKVEYNYLETGVASWYGKQFHGKSTANGEIFDMNLVSAAHRTLPLPSLVEVVNLENGRAIRVRVNDRGPFARGRILDLSRRAAQLLGFERQGTAPVKVRILEHESRRLAGIAEGRQVAQLVDDHPVPNAAPRVAVQSAELPAPDGTKSVPPTVKTKATTTLETISLEVPVVPETTDVDGVVVALTQVSGDPKMYIQAGAFVRFENANRLKAILSSIGRVHITQVRVTGRPLFRVRLGPIPTVEDADKMLAAVVKAGYSESRLVID